VAMTAAGATAGTLARNVMDGAERQRLVANVAGHLHEGVYKPPTK
jgi:hypothetical protein